MGNISESEDDIAELTRKTDYVMVGEIQFLRAKFTAKNKVIESSTLSQSMFRDQLLCSYKSASGKIPAEGVCDNRSDYIDVDTILKEISDSLT